MILITGKPFKAFITIYPFGYSFGWALTFEVAVFIVSLPLNHILIFYLRMRIKPKIMTSRLQTLNEEIADSLQLRS